MKRPNFIWRFLGPIAMAIAVVLIYRNSKRAEPESLPVPRAKKRQHGGTVAGQFITFEGIDGAGKSTHIEPLANWIRAQGLEVVVTREPGGTQLAEKLRALTLNDPMDGLTEALLMFAARRDHLANVIEPALARGAAVLCDRFTDSTFAYQGSGRRFDLGVLTQLEGWVQDGRQPDLTLWYDLPAEVAAQRRVAARAADRFEQQDLDFFERVRAGYAARLTNDPERFVRLNAEQTPDGVWDELTRAVKMRYGASAVDHA